MNLTIARALNAFGMAVVLGCLIIAGAATYSLQQLRVGGSAYTNMIAGKDLVADVLPPPLYVIEAFLTATLMADETITLDEAKARFAPLRKDFNERRAVWAGSDLPADIRAKVEASSAAGETFWRLLDSTYLPAVVAHDMDRVRKAGSELGAAYFHHRKLVDVLVTDANAFLADAEAAAQRAGVIWQAVLLSTAGVVLLFVLIGVAVIRGRVVRPVLGMAGYMSRLSKGTYDEDVPFAQRSDEIGEMAQAVSVFRTSAIERRTARQLEDEMRAAAEEARLRAEAMEKEADLQRQRVIQSLAEGLDHIARGDLDFRLNDPLAPEYEKLRTDFNASITALAETLRKISVATDQVNNGSRDITHAADDLARRTEQQAAALEETSAALNGIVDAVRRTSEMSEQARQAVVTAKQEADGSGALVQDAIAAMDLIEKSSREIGEIIVLIDEIAFQTNLLALNAGVEAARAGDAGRGFAIVAQEVRGLAQRSTEAAKGIKALISSSTHEIQSGVSLVRQTGQAFASIGDQVARVTSLVESIATSAHDQAVSLREVNSAVGQMDQTTQQNAAMVDETTSASHSLSAQAKELGGLVRKFNLGAPRTGPRKAGADDVAAASPARSLGQRLASAFGR